ncbi:carboxypeptidase-like regulatory domain-containing protein [Chryseolinea sp. T2]|uniref:carboxypeptidase-like regulatory domain-containing protein n=1 Tax=Chryseolinea sp. T2 TaxID=3129255 RepID=UPI0030772BAB
MKRWELTFCLFLFVSLPLCAQKLTHGIVVDSATLKALPGVHVRVKGKDVFAVTGSLGAFQIRSANTDTLVLTMVGYTTTLVPLLLEEEDLMIRMGERYQLLQEVTISGNRLFESDIVRTQRTAPRKMTTAEAFSSPWTYFSRDQKERRKVVKLINENDRIKTYIQVINDQETREDIMFDHDISETEYYSALALFNQQSQDVLYSTNPNEIIESLRDFFDRKYSRRK